MGVGLELMGKQVRCPHCRQIVVAPTNQPGRSVGTIHTDTPSRSQRTATPPEAKGTDSGADDLMPRYAPPVREGVESIFGEEGLAEDCALGIPQSRKSVVPDLSDPGPPLPPSAQPGMIDFNPQSSEQKELPANQHYPILGPPTPPIRKEISQPEFPQLPPKERSSRGRLPGVVVPPPADPNPEEVVNPFAKFSRPKMPAVAAPPPTEHSPRTIDPAKWFWPLLAYAVVVTILAVWGWLRPH